MDLSQQRVPMMVEPWRLLRSYDIYLYTFVYVSGKGKNVVFTILPFADATLPCEVKEGSEGDTDHSRVLERIDGIAEDGR